MTRAQQLLEKAIADPEDASARRKYRDWMTRKRDPADTTRAAILEQQCQLACKPANDPNGVRLRDLEEIGFRRFAEQWFGSGLSFLENWWNFDKGIEVSVAHYLAMDEDKLASAPIQAISLCSKHYISADEGGCEKEVKAEYIRLAKRPSLRYWLSLSLHEQWIPADCFMKLIASPQLTRLRRLYVFGSPLGDETVKAMARASNLRSLRHLCLNSLGDDGAPTDGAVKDLARSRHVAQLNSLYLQGGFSTEGVQALAGSSNCKTLQSLYLHGRLNGSCVAAIAASPYLVELTELDLGWFNTAMDDSGVEALVKWPHLHKLRSLGLGATGLTAAGLRALANSPQLSSLEMLDLSHNRMEDGSGVEALATSPHLKDIQALNLWDVSPISQSTRDKLLERFGKRVNLIPETNSA
jgi:hypothetical protein